MSFGIPTLPLPRLHLPALPVPGPLAGAGIPIWMEGRVALERAALARSGMTRQPARTDLADGPPLMLIPGFLAGDPSLTVMARWLRGLGWATCRAQIRMNVDCTGRSVSRLEEALERHQERHGGRAVTIVGHSRGGVMGRILAARRPDLVAGLVTLGSPLTEQFAVHPLVRHQIRAVATLGSAGVPGLFSHRCLEGDCCAQTTQEASRPLPQEMPFLSIYSRSDGIVDWHACLDPQAEHVEVRSSHCGMALNPSVYREIEAWLPSPSTPTGDAANDGLRMAAAA